MGKPKTQTVTQKTEIDPILEGYLTSGQLPEDKLASLRRVNEGVYGLAPGTLQPVLDPTAAIAPVAPVAPRTSGMEQRREEQRMQSHIDSVNQRNRDRSIVESGGFGYDPSTGNEMQPGGRDLSMRSGGMYAMGGIVGLPAGGMAPPMMGGGMPNMGNRDMAYQMAMQAMRPQPYAMGGYVEGPGTGTSDSIPAKIYQDGEPVQEAALSDGEFVMTERAVRGAGNGDPKSGAARMYEMMRKFEQGGKVR
ncbi:MAG TPA: hypothetical protein VKA18_02415 [Alphaproteobacteria bacterium]|nr:hypothetical protein [Alphaproteobacteria bacterium]